MSKENAKKFYELIGSEPAILKEGEKHDKGQGDVYAIYSELAKEKGFDCTASELKEIMRDAHKGISELSSDDLENVSGGSRSTMEKAILSGIMALSGILEGVQQSMNEDGTINWRETTTYINMGKNAFSKGIETWSKADT